MKIKNLLWIVVGFAAACSKTSREVPSLVQGEVHSEVLSTSRPNAMTGQKDSVALSVEVGLAKSAVLGREFLYGADLQYSSQPDVSLGLTLQSIAVGHIPSHFEIRGDSLDLVADQKILFESDINHPEKLLQRFKIVSQDDNTLRVKIRSASRSLVSVFTESGKAEPSVAQNWIRSVEFVPENNMLLLESSVEMADGRIAEFLESIIPRTSLVKNDVKALYADEAREPQAKRFRFLSFGPVFVNFGEERAQTQTASRYDISDGRVIDWYVTPNAPAEYLPDLKNSVEAWNRYSQKMFGKDFIAFKGLLPPGVKVGDPRYNVINWDSVAKAGAAYASSAADPTTGIISHSLIYMPRAWINIGKDYWENGKFSERQAKVSERMARKVASASFLGRKVNLNCIMDAAQNLTLSSRKNPEAFARELLKGVVMHEIGHTLGLDHNFKASLVYNPAEAHSIFSTSIMDYNQYNLERAFDSLDSAQGPLLEYDRQILSVLYNSGRDIAATDVVLPACGDEQSDSEEGGVDPLCIRYDAGYDPSLYLEGVRGLFEKENFRLGAMRSLAESLLEVKQEFPDPTQLTSQAQVKEELAKLTATTRGLLSFYLLGNANSISYLTRANLRLLKLYKVDALPASYDAKALRTRALAGVDYVRTLAALPAAPLKAFEQLGGQLEQWLARTAYIHSLEEARRAGESVSLLGDFKGLPAQMAAPGAEFSQVRTALWAAIKRSEKAPFEIVDASDIEAVLVGHLAQAVTENFAGKTRAFAERSAAALSLATFKDTLSGGVALESARNQVLEEVKKSVNAREREELRALLTNLSGETVEKKKD